MTGPSNQARQGHKWPHSLSREAAPVHKTTAVFNSHRDTGGGQFVLRLPPHPAAVALLELGEGGLVTPEHLRPVLLRPAFMVQTPCKPRRLVPRADEWLPSCDTIL